MSESEDIQQQFEEFLRKNKIDFSSLKGTTIEKDILDPK